MQELYDLFMPFLPAFLYRPPTLKLTRGNYRRRWKILAGQKFIIRCNVLLRVSIRSFIYFLPAPIIMQRSPLKRAVPIQYHLANSLLNEIRPFKRRTRFNGGLRGSRCSNNNKLRPSEGRKECQVSTLKHFQARVAQSKGRLEPQTFFLSLTRPTDREKPVINRIKPGVLDGRPKGDD